MKKVFFLMAFLAVFNAIVYSEQLLDNDDAPSIYPNKITLNEKIVGLSKLWSEIKYNFVNIDQISFDIDSLYAEYLNHVVNSKNDVEYYDVLGLFIAHFKDSHTEVYSPYRWNDYNDYIPMIFKEYNNGIYLVSIRKGSCLDSTYIGAKLLEIESSPVMEWMEKNVYSSIAASNDKIKQRIAVLKIHGGVKNSYFNATVQKLDGTITSIHVKRDGEQTRIPEDQSWGIEISRKYFPIETIWKNKIAILGIKTFQPEKMIDLIDSHISEIIENEPQGLIIDLRNNGGGSSNVGFHLQKYLTSQDYFISFGWERRINDGYGRAQGNYRKEYELFYLYKAYKAGAGDTIRIKYEFSRIKVPVVILINENCASACEDFLVNIYEVPNRPLIFGTETSGTTGAPLVINMPNGGMARICTLRITYPYSGKPFVKKGISPDIEVCNSLEDDLSDYDRTLETAINHIKSSQ